MASFFFNDLGLSLGARLVSTNDRPSYSSIILRLFPSGGEKKKCAAFCTGLFQAEARKKMCCILHEPVGGTPGRACTNFLAKNRRSGLPVFNIKQNLAKKLDHTLEPRNWKGITCLTHFYAQKYKCPRRF